MIIATVLMAGLVVFASAQRKSEECLPAFMTEDSPYNPMPKPGDVPGCFKGAYLPKTRRDVEKECMEDSNLEAPLVDGNAEDMNKHEIRAMAVLECTLKKMGKVDDSGNLRTETFDEFSDDMVTMKDPEDVDFVKSMFKRCEKAVNTTGLKAVDHFVAITTCNLADILKYCEDKGRDPGQVATMVSFQSLYEPAKCQSVKFVKKVLPALKCAVSSIGKSEERRSKKMGMFGASKFDRNGGGMKSPAKVHRILMRLAASLGLHDPITGANYEVLKVLIRDLPGWDDLTEELDATIAAIDECAMKAPYDTSTPEEVAELFPWVPRPPPLIVQCHRFTQCFLPRFSKVCGLNNQLALFFFPHLMETLPEMMVDAILGEDLDLAMDLLMVEDEEEDL